MIDYLGDIRERPFDKMLADPSNLHTSYALQSGYELILRGIGRVTIRDIERLAQRLTAAGDARDVLNAFNSVARLLGLRALQP